jgi:phospholipase C
MDLRDPHDAERAAFENPDAYLRRREFLQRTAVLAGLSPALATVLSPSTLVAEAARRMRPGGLPSPRNLPIDTFVVLMMENRSFDHYLGWLPHADGHQRGLVYVDRTGAEVPTRPLAPDWQGCAHPDPDHSWDGGRVQIDGGRMDGFLRSGANDVFAVSYYRKHDLPFIPAAARAFTTYDRFFCSLLASTFPNREYMHAAQSYGMKDNSFPPPGGFPDTTIFHALALAGIDARYFYSDLPFSALWGEAGLARSSPVKDYYDRAAAGTLPALSFVDPVFAGEEQGTSGDEHPHGDVRVGQAFMSDVVHAFIESPQWSRGALFIVYDEWGGFFDHVPPPRVPDDRGNPDLAQDFGQMGIRIPAVVVSPWVRRHHVDHTAFGFESILKLIEYKFGLDPLTLRDKFANNIGVSFDWDRRPRLEPPPLPDAPAVIGAACAMPPSPTAQVATRPREHDMVSLVRSGWLERLGFDYRPARHEDIFRAPHTIRAAHAAAGGRP